MDLHSESNHHLFCLFFIVIKEENNLRSFERSELERNINLWGECGGTGYTASCMYKYWSYNYTNKVRKDNVTGDFFHRGTGKRVRIKGSFLNDFNNIYGYEISHSLDYEEGKSYEFVKQKLSTTQSQILGYDVCFVFEPDNNATMNFTDETYFSFKRFLVL